MGDGAMNHLLEAWASRISASRSWDGMPLDSLEGQGPRSNDTPPERTGSGDFVFWHGTSIDNAREIAEQRHVLPDDFGMVGVCTTQSAAAVFAVMKGGGTGSAIVRLEVSASWLAEHRVQHEVGGSGHDQFLIGPPRRMGEFSGIPSWAINDIQIYVNGDEGWARTAAKMAMPWTIGPDSDALVLYHGTPKSNVDSINEVGLVENAELPDGVWLVDSPERARRYAGEGGAIYEVQVPKEWVTQQVQRGVFTSDRPIPPSMIRRTAAADLHLDYQPDDTAPVQGEWVMEPDPSGMFENGVATGWRQQHRALVEAALYSWKGDPVEASIHMTRIKNREPTLGSGSGKQMDMRAAALLYEVEHNGRTNPIRLYRGSNERPMGFEAWSEKRSVAQRFQRMGDGDMFVLAPGDGHGIRIADYISSGLDQVEFEWIIDTDRSKVPS